MSKIKLDPFNYHSSPEEKFEYNRRLFKIVAPQYNKITRLLSFNFDKIWKRDLVQLLPDLESPCIGDIACGTGDLSHLCSQRFPSARVIAMDLSFDMIRIAKKSFLDSPAHFSVHDMGSPGIRSNSFDMITGGYALRNAPSLLQTFREVARILKPGGVAVFLDFARPANPVRCYLHLSFLEIWGNIWGFLVHKNRNVYAYIARSLRNYPSRKGLISFAAKERLILKNVKSYMLGYIDILKFQKLSQEDND